MKLQLRSRSVLPLTSSRGAFSSPLNQAAGFDLPHANYNRTNPAWAPVRSTLYSPTPSHHSNPH